jgi:hypothetical protein
MSESEKQVDRLLLFRDAVLAEMRRAEDAKRVWELYQLKRQIDVDLISLSAL